MLKTVEDRFWEKVDKSGDCWLWTACTSGRDENSQYGAFKVSSYRKVDAHCYAWRMANGPVPKGMMVDHRCRNTLCVRAAHLRLVTNKQNQENQSPVLRVSESGFRGVRRHRSKWQVVVKHQGKTHCGGSFATPEEAHTAAQALRNGLFTHNDGDRNEGSVR